MKYNLYPILIKMYAMMTVIQLKEELRKRNMTLSGKKAVLVERLETFDRNHNNFVVESDNDEVFYCPLPECFRDINASTALPPFNKQHIQAFAERFQTQLKGRRMYESRFLLTARVAVEGNATFIQGQCKAEMKKITYIVNVKLNLDGSIQESNCECAAGSGVEAHCKHIMVLLYGVEDMARNKNIILHQVCTQRLMTFKQPKKLFRYSPLKAENIPNSRKRNVNFLPLLEEEIMENYNDYIRNVWISYGNTSVSILHNYRSANPYAVEQDHNYLNKNLSDRVLEDLLLKNITSEQISGIEECTRQQYDSKKWHLHRSYRITASNFHPVAHSKLSTRKHLAEKILNPKPFYSRSTAHGRVQEQVALQKYAEMFDLCLRPCGLYVSVTHPFLGASPDAILNDDTIIEVKCPYTARYYKISVVSVPYLEIVDYKLSLKKNHPYYYQVQGQLFCANKKYCNLIVYTFVDLEVIFIDRDDLFINNMVSQLTMFYTEYFEKAVLEKILYKHYKK